MINAFIHINMLQSSHSMYILTIKDYAGISDPHGVRGNAGIVAIVFFWDVEEDQHWLFTLILYLNPV